MVLLNINDDGTEPQRRVDDEKQHEGGSEVTTLRIIIVFVIMLEQLLQ